MHTLEENKSARLKKRLVLADRSQIRGADVYRHVMRRVWWAYPLYLISVAALSRLVFEWGYRTFAANRYRISGACRLKPVLDGEPRATTDNNQTQRSPTQATASPLISVFDASEENRAVEGGLLVPALARAIERSLGGFQPAPV